MNIWYRRIGQAYDKFTINLRVILLLWQTINIYQCVRLTIKIWAQTKICLKN